MKKTGIVFMLSLTLLFIGFSFGLLFARSFGRNLISLSASGYTAATSINETVAISATGKININDATVQDLTLLPGIGETLAQRIIAYRETSGPFNSIDELLNVKGIGQNRLTSISEYITVGG